MQKSYFLSISPEKGQALQKVLFNQEQTTLVKRVREELHGLGQIDKGISRQMVLSRAEFRLVRRVNEENKLGIEVQSL